MSDAAQKAVMRAVKSWVRGVPDQEAYEFAAHVLAVLSETHAVVELPEPDVYVPGRQTYELTEPRRGSPPVLCNHCPQEIEAWRGVSIHGIEAGYDWRHVADGSTACVQAPLQVQPYDHWDAGRALDTSRAEATQ